MENLKFGINEKFLENKFRGILFQGENYALFRTDDGDYFYVGCFIEPGTTLVVKNDSVIYEILNKSKKVVLNGMSRVYEKEMIYYAESDLSKHNFYVDSKELIDAKFTTLTEEISITKNSNGYYSIIFADIDNALLDRQDDLNVFELISYIEVFKGKQGILECLN